MSNALLQGKYVGNPTILKDLRADVSSELIFISHEHSKIHEGKLFGAGYMNATLANDGNLDLHITTPVDYSVHTYIKTSGGGDSEFLIYEGTTFTANGTAITPINHNRTSSNVATTLAYHTPTVNVIGTQLWQEFVPGGSGGASPGAVGHPTSEQVVLAPNTEYLFRLVNRSGVVDYFNLLLSFYEVPA